MHPGLKARAVFSADESLRLSYIVARFSRRLCCFVGCACIVLRHCTAVDTMSPRAIDHSEQGATEKFAVDYANASFALEDPMWIFRDAESTR